MKVLSIVRAGFSSNLVMMNELSRYFASKPDLDVSMNVTTIADVIANIHMCMRYDVLLFLDFTEVATKVVEGLSVAGLQHPAKALRLGVDPIWDLYKTRGHVYPKFDSAFEVELMNYQAIGCYTEQLTQHTVLHGFDNATRLIPGVDRNLYKPSSLFKVRRREANADHVIVGTTEAIDNLRGGYKEIVCPAIHGIWRREGVIGGGVDLSAALLDDCTRLPVEDMPSWYNSIDVLAHAPSSQDVGRSAIEAIACGRPVIGTDTGVLSEVVTKSGGMLIERSSDALTKALSEIRPGAANWEPWKEACQRAADASYFYHWENAADSWITLFNEARGLL